MDAKYVVHVPKATEVYIEDNLPRALDAGANFKTNEFDVVTVFRVDDDGKTPVAFFWNGQKFTPPPTGADAE